MRKDRIENAVRLLSAAFGFANQPGLKSGLSVYDTAKKLLTKSPPSIRTLADDLTLEAVTTYQEVAAEWHRGLPADADVLFVQMLEATLPDRHMLVAHDKDPTRIAAAMRAKLTDPDHLRVPMPDVFEQIMRKVLIPLCKSTVIGAELTEPYMQRVLAEMAEDRSESRAQWGQVDARLSGIEAILKGEFVPLDTLESLARAFGMSDPVNREQMESFLFQHAEHFLAAQKKLALVDESHLRAAALKAEAQAKMNQSEFGAVEPLLAEAHALDIGIARATAEIRIDLAMSEGAVEIVYRHALAVAESVGSIDGQEPARIKIEDYAPRLIDAAERYDLNGTFFGLALIAPCLTDRLRASDPQLWAKAQHHYGHASAINALNSATESGFFKQAIGAFDAAQTVRTLADHPDLWVETEYQRAKLLADFSRREADSDMLKKAVGSIKTVQKVAEECGKEALISRTEFISGKLLLDISQTVQDPAASLHTLQAAEQAFDSASEYFEMRSPDIFAQIQQSRGRAKSILAMHSDAGRAEQLVNEARLIYLEASNYYARTGQPVRRIEALLNFSAITMQVASLPTTAIPRTALEKALTILDLVQTALISTPVPDLMELEGMVRKDLTDMLELAP